MLALPLDSGSVCMTTSRPTRPGFRHTAATAPVSGPADTTTAGTSNATFQQTAVAHGSHSDFESLRLRHQQLQAQRNRLELLAEQAATEVGICQRQAEAMGISSLEELQQRIKEMEEQDAQAMATFKEQLKKEEALQEQAKRSLAEIDREET